MRILFITGEFSPMPGGVADYTRILTRALVAHGVEVCILTSDKAAIKGDEYQVSTAPLDQVPVMRILPAVRKWEFPSLTLMAEAIRDFKPDVVHIQYQTGGFGLRPWINMTPNILRIAQSGRLRILGGLRIVPKSPIIDTIDKLQLYSMDHCQPKFATTFHDLVGPNIIGRIAGPLRSKMTMQLAASSDLAIVTNDEDYKNLAAFKLKPQLIPIGSNIPYSPPQGFQRSRFRQHYRIADSDTLLCYFGSVNIRKGVEILLESLAYLLRTQSVINPHLLMIGDSVGGNGHNSTNRTRVDAVIRGFSLTDHVTWTSRLSDSSVTEAFLSSDMCVLPFRDGASYRHGTLHAALAHGMPIVTTAPPVISDGRLPPLVNEENCLLVRADDVSAFATAILSIATSPVLRKKLSAGAFELAQHFAWDKIVIEHVSQYEHLLNKNHSNV